MKKAILYLVFVTALVSLMVVPERVTFLFFVDYTLRLTILSLSGKALDKLEKRPARA